MKTIFFLFVSFLCVSCSVQTDNDSACNETIIISSVGSHELLRALLLIEKCANGDKKLEVYVRGSGGAIHGPQMFFEQMRAKGLSERVRFIAFGEIWSSSNLVWLAADERVVTPGTVFVHHKMHLNNEGEDEQTRADLWRHYLYHTTQALNIAIGDDAANLWEISMSGCDQGGAFDGAEALKNGWATELLPY